MSKGQRIKQIAEKMAPVFEKYALEYAGIFGSYARGDEKEESDVDILFRRGSKKLSLLDHIGMKDEISDILNKKVDLVSESAIIPYFKDHIFNDLRVIYGER